MNGPSIVGRVEPLESRQMLAATPVTGAWMGGAFDQIGLYENGFWQLDLDGDLYVGDDSPAFVFGAPGDLPVTGDWNGNGIASVGVYRSGVFYLDFDDDRVFTSADVAFEFGIAGDVPVAGNWNGVGGDEIGIFRDGTWLLDVTGDFAFGAGDASFTFGSPTGVPLAGNWNPADFRDSVATYDGGIWTVDVDEDYARGAADFVFQYGTGADIPFTGDFGGDNTDDIGVLTTVGGRPTLSIAELRGTPAGAVMSAAADEPAGISESVSDIATDSSLISISSMETDPTRTVAADEPDALWLVPHDERDALEWNLLTQRAT